MLEAGVEMIASSGLTVSLEHLSFEEVIQQARVSRSAVYRLWPSKDRFFNDLLMRLATSTHPAEAAYDQGTVDLATELVRENAELLRSEEGRFGLTVEICRQGALQNFQAIYESTEWRTYIALNATLTGLTEPLQEEMAEYLRTSERTFIGRMADFYEQMSALLGFRIKVCIDQTYETLATLGGAGVEGLVIKALSNPEIATRRFKANPFGGPDTGEWSLPAIAFTSVVLSLIEIDPDWTFDPSALTTLGE